MPHSCLDLTCLLLLLRNSLPTRTRTHESWSSFTGLVCLVSEERSKGKPEYRRDSFSSLSLLALRSLSLAALAALSASASASVSSLPLEASCLACDPPAAFLVSALSVLSDAAATLLATVVGRLDLRLLRRQRRVTGFRRNKAMKTVRTEGDGRAGVEGSSPPGRSRDVFLRGRS